jgi:hypothetical protein
VLVYHKKRWVPKNGVPGALEAVDNPVDKAEVAKGEEKVS